MLKNKTINLKVVEEVGIALGEINQEVIFVGGAIVSLYATDLGADEARPTKDIDLSVQISSYPEMDELRQRLATKRIFPAAEEDVLYRYKLEDILIDFIPFEETALGPTNSWLKPGFEKAIKYSLANISISILPVSFFLATKWEAFENRAGDPRWSHDLEDIVYVIDNNLDVVREILGAGDTVKLFLIQKFKELLENPNLGEIIECFVNPYVAAERRLIIIDKLKKITKS